MQGNHPVYYPIDRYERRLATLGSKFHGQKTRTQEFLLAGLIECGCGRMMTGKVLWIKTAGGNSKFVIVYTHRCERKTNARTGRPGGQLMYYETRLFELLDSAMKQARFSPAFAHNLKLILRDYLDKRNGDRSKERTAITRKINGIYEKKDRLVAAIAGGLIDDLSALNLKIHELNKEVQQLERERELLETGTEKVMPKIEEIIEKMRDMPAIYLDAPPEGKVEIMRAMVKSVVIEGETAQIRWSEPFTSLMIDELLELKKQLPDRELRECSEILPQASGMISSMMKHFAENGF